MTIPYLAHIPFVLGFFGFALIFVLAHAGWKRRP
jgi:hypothetical protein